MGTYLDLLAKYGIDGAHPGGLQLTAEVIGKLNINNETKLIDLGCGTGQTLAFISGFVSCSLTGVDIDERMLSTAAFRLVNTCNSIKLVQADITALPFPDNSFDIALSESVTIFTPIDKALKEYHRILKPGGMLAAIEMTAADYLTPDVLKDIQSVYGIESVPTAKQWHNLFYQAGFHNIQTYKANVSPSFRFTSYKMLFDFLPHIYILNRYGKKLGYKIYFAAS